MIAIKKWSGRECGDETASGQAHGCLLYAQPDDSNMRALPRGGQVEFYPCAVVIPPENPAGLASLARRLGEIEVPGYRIVDSTIRQRLLPEFLLDLAAIGTGRRRRVRVWLAIIAITDSRTCGRWRRSDSNACFDARDRSSRAASCVRIGPGP